MLLFLPLAVGMRERGGEGLILGTKYPGKILNTALLEKREGKKIFFGQFPDPAVNSFSVSRSLPQDPKETTPTVGRRFHKQGKRENEEED